MGFRDVILVTVILLPVKCLFNRSLKDHVKSVLRISSAHNKEEPTDINIAQILHLSNFFELKHTLVYIHLQLQTRKVLDIQLVCLILQI
jgi:hypothetical protein